MLPSCPNARDTSTDDNLSAAVTTDMNPLHDEVHRLWNQADIYRMLAQHNSIHSNHRLQTKWNMTYITPKASKVKEENHACCSSLDKKKHGLSQYSGCHHRYHHTSAVEGSHYEHVATAHHSHTSLWPCYHSQPNLDSAVGRCSPSYWNCTIFFSCRWHDVDAMKTDHTVIH